MFHTYITYEVQNYKLMIDGSSVNTINKTSFENMSLKAEPHPHPYNVNLVDKKVTANKVTLEFGTLPKVTIPDGSPPILKARLEISNPLANQQEAKCLLPLTLKTRKVMWLHLDLAKVNNGIQRNPN